MPESNAKVTGDFSNLINGAENAAKALGKIGMAVTGVEGLKKTFDMLTSTVGGTVNVLAKVGQAAMGIEAIGRSGAAMANGLLKGNAALEMTQISFKTLLGSATAADDMIKQLTTFAATTPFNLPGLEASTQKLLAFGFSAKDIVPLMTSMGDAIAALGGTQDNLNSLVYVMGQMRSEAHINAGDIMQMTNLGIPALQMLADHYKVTTGEMQKMISKGLVPGTAAVDIFTKGLEQKYGGMMKAQSATFSGMISNLQDWATATTIILTKPFFEPAKKGLEKLLEVLQSPAGEAAINKMAGYIQAGVDRATKAFILALPSIKAWAGNLEQTYSLVMARFAPGVAGLGNQLEALWKKFQPTIKAIWDFKNAISPLSIALDVLKGYLTGGMAGAIDALKTRLEKIAGYARTAFNFVLEEARKFGGRLLSWALSTAVMLADKVVGWGQALIVWVAPYAVKLVNELIALAGRVFNWAVTYAPVLADQMLTWAESIASWVIPAIPKVLTALVQLGLGVLSWVEREAPLLVKMLLNWTDAMAGWVIPAIPPLIRALEQLAATVVSWAVTRLPRLLGQIVVGVGRGLGVNLQRPVNDVLQIFYSLVDSIGSTVLPAFDRMAVFLANNLLPLLDQLSGFIANNLIPTIASLAAFAMDVLVPAFVRAGEVFGLAFGPALTLIGSLIRDDLLPTLTNLWQTFDSQYMPTVRKLAGEFGEHLAGSIQTAVDKFKIAEPGLESFFKKLEPIVIKALELYQAISPLSVGLDVLTGVLTGGLPGGFKALEDHVIAAGKVFGVDLGPTVKDFNAFVTEKVLPTLRDWGKWIGDTLVPIVKDLGKTFVTDVLPKVGEFVAFASDKIIPILKSMGEWFELHVIPIVQALVKTFDTDVVPALGRFWKFAQEKIFPMLGDFLDWIGKKIVPALGVLVAFFLDKLLPTLVNWWQIIAQVLRPIIEWLVDFIVKQVVPGLGRVTDFLNNNFFPAFRNVVNFLQTYVFPVLRTLADIFTNTVGKALGFVIDRVGDVIRFFTTVANIIGKLIQGDWGGAVQVAFEFVTGPKQIISGSNVPIPAHAAGTTSAARGLALVGEEGAELIKTIGGQLMLATKPLFMNMQGGEQVYNNRETLAMFRSQPASPAQIHQMYQTSNSYGGNNSTTNHNNSFQFRADMPVDLNNALQRWYNGQVWKYGR